MNKKKKNKDDDSLMPMSLIPFLLTFKYIIIKWSFVACFFLFSNYTRKENTSL